MARCAEALAMPVNGWWLCQKAHPLSRAHPMLAEFIWPAPRASGKRRPVHCLRTGVVTFIVPRLGIFTMPDIKVVVFLVRCSQSLLICDDVNTEHLSFADMPACIAEIPGLIETAKRASLANHVFMGRCHYLVNASHRRPWTGKTVESTSPPDELSEVVRVGVE